MYECKKKYNALLHLVKVSCNVKENKVKLNSNTCIVKKS